jgi:N-acyl-phosphatidylethanolamine-hydrolysing phospholipase D
MNTARHAIKTGRYFFYFLIIYLVALGHACQNEQMLTNKPKHHTENGFRNLYLKDEGKSFFKFLKMRISEDWADQESQAKDVPQVKIDLDRLHHPKDPFQITWIGHSTFLIQINGINILTDPIFAERASPLSLVGPKRYTEPATVIENLAKIDFVLISHNHYDHLDQSSIAQLQQHSPQIKWFIPLGNRALLIDEDVPEDHIVEMDWWQERSIKTSLKSDIKFTCTPAQHWSARGLFDRFKALWSSWVIEIGDQKIYFAGDTGYNDVQFKEIGDRFKDFDLALIPIGAYAPRWFMKAMHVDPNEAIQMHRDLKSKFSIGMHWGTFPLTAEPAIEPMDQLKKLVKNLGLNENEFITIAIGETFRINQRIDN